MRNENVFMARKKQYGALPTGKKLKPLRAKSEPEKPGKMDRHDQSLKDRNVGNAWWYLGEKT